MKSPDNESADFSAMGIDYMMRFEAMQAELAALQRKSDRLAAALKLTLDVGERLFQWIVNVAMDDESYANEESAWHEVLELSGSSAALDKLDDWQSIKTAPCGQPLLLFSPVIRPHIDAKNCEGGLIWVTGGPGVIGKWRGDSNKNPPTHWKPLPDPPKAAALRSSTGSGDAQEGKV